MARCTDVCLISGFVDHFAFPALSFGVSSCSSISAGFGLRFQARTCHANLQKRQLNPSTPGTGSLPAYQPCNYYSSIVAKFLVAVCYCLCKLTE